MNLYDFIFSANKKARVIRHAGFWFARYIFLVFSNLVYLNQFPGKSLFRDNLDESLTISAWTTLGEIALIYILFYGIAKIKLNRFRNLQLIIYAIALSSIIFKLEYPLCIKIMRLGNFPPEAFWTIWNCFMYYSGTSLTMAGLFAVFKMFRKYYFKMEETQMLERENIEAEAKWLKAQVHPHFLFNTLNNIYSSILIRSPKAADLLDNLSNLLRYMTHENDEQFVPLEKEIQLLNNYIGLQKVRYDERLQIEMEVKGEYEHEMIAPLLLIPLLENAFKHGVSKLNAQKWIHIIVKIENEQLFFSISNSKPASLNAANKTNGIGLDNVRKRLEYIYHGAYDFGITETENIFAVNLNVPLLQQKNYNSFQFKPQKISGYA